MNNVVRSKEVTKLDRRKYTDAIAEIEGLDADQLYNDFDKLYWMAKRDHDRYREIKSNYLHDIPQIDDEMCQQFYSIVNRYERNSMALNSLIRVSYANKLPMHYTRRVLLGETPPAFDKNLIAEPEYDLLEDIKDYVINRRTKLVEGILVALDRELRLKKIKCQEEGCFPILKNGSSTSIQDGVNVNDIASIAYSPPQWFLDEFDYTIEYFRVESFTNSFLLPYPMKDESSRIGGEILSIPDKEAKIRTIFRMRWYVQMLSKILHEVLEEVARTIPGNYTYDHKKWLKEINAMGYNKTAYIITTDMSKYSDTLSRQFMIFILEQAGWDKQLLQNIDSLWSLPVIDGAGNIYSDSMSSYQGQYGNFPMITIVNLILQSYVFYKLKEPINRLSIAAVGDDTGMMFPHYRENVFRIVKNVYGSVGVNINRSKTHELICGHGFADFVKLELTSKGITPFVNPSSVIKNNVDGFITDIYDYMKDTGDIKGGSIFFHKMFGSRIANELMNLSVINGGISDHMIAKRDIDIFVTKMTQYRVIKELSTDDEMRKWMKMYEDILVKNNVSYKDTPFIGWFEGFSEWFKKTKGSIDAYLKLNILNASEIGYDMDGGTHYFDLLIGLRWSELKLMSKKNQLQDNIQDMVSIIDQSESIEAYRRRESINNRRKTSVYMNIVSIISHGMLNESAELTFDDPTYVTDYDEYQDSRLKYQIRKNWRACLAIIGKFLSIEEYFGNTHYYIVLPETDTHGKPLKYRHYSTISSEKYRIIPEELYNKYFEGMSYEEYKSTIKSWCELNDQE